MSRLIALLFSTLLVVTGCHISENEQFGSTERSALEAQPGLNLVEHHLWDRGGLNWASVTLKNAAGDWVTGRELADFELTETLLEDTQPITFDKESYQFDGPGFWERSVTDQKLDIVFIVDTSGTMSQEIGDIRTELHAFLDRLLLEHVDFRMGLIGDEWAPGDYDPFPLRGPMMAAEIHAAIDDYYLDTAGEWWEPNTGYDSILHALGEMRWRQDSDVRRVIVLITDTLPQSVYGSFWHLDSTASNRTAARLALNATGTEFYYSQPETRDEVMDHPDMDNYTRADTNPRAGCRQTSGGRWDCGFLDLGTRIRWPFHQSDLALASGQPLTDSRYYFAWVSGFQGIDEPDRQVKVTITTDDPDKPGSKLDTSFEYNPYEKNFVTLTVNPTDARGEIAQDVSLRLLAEMGDRRASIDSSGPNTAEPGQVEFDLLLPGTYRVCTGYNCWPRYYDYYAYSEMDFQGSLEVDIPSGGLTTGWQLEVVDHSMDLLRARGLLEDLRVWGVTERPFRDFAAGANAWLDALETGGIALTQDEQIRRFSVALSGYVNTAGYAEVEAERITEDFQKVLYKFRDIIERVRDLAKDSDVSLGIAAVEATARLDLANLAEIIATEVTVDKLKEYAESELVPLVIDKIIEQIPAGIHKDLLELMIEGLILGHWDDWPGLLQTMAELALDDAMDAVRSQVGTEITDDVLDAVDVNQTAEEQIKILLDEFAHHGFGSDFSAALENIQSQLLALGPREQVQHMVDDIFDRIQDQLNAGAVRDFVVPMIRLVTRGAIQQGHLDNNVVINVLAHYFTHQVILKSTYSEPVAAHLTDALATIQGFTPTVSDPADWTWERYTDMDSDFGEFRVADAPPFDGMREINDDTWSKLSKQDMIDDMAQVLSYVSDIVLPALETLFSSLCSAGYPTCAIASDVKDFIAVLDAVGLMTKVKELRLKAEDLTHLAQDVDFINDALLVE
jgi:hypothetical protein